MTSAAPAYATRFLRRSRGLPRRPSRRRERQLLILAPFFTFIFVSGFYFYLDKASAGILGLMLVVALRNRAGDALRWLIVFLPFTLLFFSWLYKLGVPAQYVRPLAFWKEALVGVVVVAAVLQVRRHPVRLDLVDTICLSYVALSLGYLLVPDVFVDGIGAHLPFGFKLNGFRSDCLYVGLFVAARHARMPAAKVLQAAKAFAATAGVIAVIGLYEYFRPASWNDFVINTIGLTRYKTEILGVIPSSDPYLYDVRVYTSVAGRDVLRLGGVVINYQQIAFLFVVALAFLAESQLRQRGGKRTWATIALPLCAAGVILSQTRSGLLALGATLGLVVLRAPGRQLVPRIRMTIVVGGLVVLALPMVFAIGLGDRLAGKDDYSSNEGHSESTSSGLALLFDRPLGTGLATAAGVGQSTGEEIHVSENQFLQIGTQLGIVGLLLWLSAYGAIIAKLTSALAQRRHVLNERPDDPAATVAAGARTGLLAMIPAMFFLQVYVWFTVSWTLWALAGAALGALERGDDGEETSDPSSSADRYALSYR